MRQGGPILFDQALLPMDSPGPMVFLGDSVDVPGWAHLA
jgi:hypothetical protein